MANAKGKRAIAIALFLMLTMATSIVALPAANAQAPGTKNTFAVIDCIPNPVGKGQEVLINFGITDFTVKPQMGWTGLTVEITRPDGKTEILGPFMTDTTGLTGTTYVPTLVGNYTLQAHFPQQNRTAGMAGRTQPAGTIMKASSSDKLILVVQEEPIPYYPGLPLPTEYWTRPIDSQSREWSSIAGNWLRPTGFQDSMFAPFNEGPETPHILWAKPIAMGGLVGGELGEHGFEDGDAYEGKFASPAIIGGVLYYNRFAWGFAGMQFQQGIHAVDLRTGEELWFKNNTRLSFAQVFYWSSYNYHGAYAYLWQVVGTTWHAYCAFTGEWQYSMTNVPAHSVGGLFAPEGVRGPNGEIFRYTISLTGRWMTLWNSTQVIATEGSFGSVANTQTTFNATRGIMWNKTIPSLPGTALLAMEDRIIGSNTEDTLGLPQPNPVFWAISIAPGQEGQLIFNTTWTLPIPDLHVHIPSAFVPTLEDGVFIVAGKETTQYWGFDINTGKQVWGPTPKKALLDAYTIIYPAILGQVASGYGIFVSGGMGGIVDAYVVKNGTHLWRYEAKDHYSEILFANNWQMVPLFISDGKVYLAHAEHSVIDPKPRGAPFICLDLKSGKEIFRVDGLIRTTRWGGLPIIGDSIIAAFDTYDNRIYAIGKGPSATTVTASPKVLVHGNKVLVEGMVTDISAGTKSPGLAMRFPNGVPAVADESMGDWMLYIYKQFPCPANVKGVEVVVEVLDPNNNYYEVARATSDATGFYRCTFKPPVPGEYTIVARFEGSKSYWGSYAETAIVVEDAPPPTPEPTPTPASVADIYFLPVSIGMIIAIIIVLVLLILLLRRK